MIILFSRAGQFNLTVWCAPAIPQLLGQESSGAAEEPSGSITWHGPLTSHLFRCPTDSYMYAINVTALPNPRGNRPPVTWWFACRPLPSAYITLHEMVEGEELWVSGEAEVRLDSRVITEVRPR